MSATAAEEREARLLCMSVNHHETLAAESVEVREQRRPSLTTPSAMLDARLETRQLASKRDTCTSREEPFK